MQQRLGSPPKVRLAALGGVYSNHRALEAVLADIGSRSADVAWCLGDLGGFGPRPDRSVDLIRDRNLPTLRGNYDDSIARGLDDCGCGYSDPRDRRFAQISYDYTLAKTSGPHRAWMRGLPEQARLTIVGRRVLLCHGSPRRVNEFLWESTCSNAFLDWLCDAYAADVIVCTHTGLPWQRALPSGRYVVNVGAIGRPANDGRTEVVYGELDFGSGVDVRFRHVAYEHESLAREMENERLPAEFVATIRTGWWTTCLENLPAPERRRGLY